MRVEHTETYTCNFFTENPELIREKTQRLMRKLMESVADCDFAQVNQLLQDSKSMRYSIQGYKEELTVAPEIKEMLTSAGYATAIIDAMQLYTEKLHAQNEIFKIKTKYRDKLLQVLAERGTLLHSDLASALGVSPSGLNAIIRQMDAVSVKLVRTETVSKYKLYSITPTAYKYIMSQKTKEQTKKVRDIPLQRDNFYEGLEYKYCRHGTISEIDIDFREKTEPNKKENFTVLSTKAQKSNKFQRPMEPYNKIEKLSKKLA